MRLPFDPDDYPISFDPVQTLGAEQCSATIPEPKLYVLVRRDLPWPVRCVQAVHAAMQLMAYSVTLENNYFSTSKYGPAVVLLGVPDELDLFEWLAKLPGSVGFREPDLFDTLTAVAYYGQQVPGLSGLRLM